MINNTSQYIHILILCIEFINFAKFQVGSTSVAENSMDCVPYHTSLQMEETSNLCFRVKISSPWLRYSQTVNKKFPYHTNFQTEETSNLCFRAKISSPWFRYSQIVNKKLISYTIRWKTSRSFLKSFKLIGLGGKFWLCFLLMHFFRFSLHRSCASTSKISCE